MRRTTSILSAFVLMTAASLAQSKLPSQPPQPATTDPSKVACSDSTTILPANRTPEACAESDFALYGHPVMFPLRNGIAYGVSLAPDKPGSVTIWMDNQADQPKSFGFCCNATFIRYIDVYAPSGNRVPSKLEITNEKSPLADPRDLRSVPMCSCSGFGSVPPHSLKVIDHGDISTAFGLAPGRYTIVEYPQHAPGTPAPVASPTLPASGPRLAITLP